jgi:hypothetical protein
MKRRYFTNPSASGMTLTKVSARDVVPLGRDVQDGYLLLLDCSRSISKPGALDQASATQLLGKWEKEARNPVNEPLCERPKAESVVKAGLLSPT